MEQLTPAFIMFTVTTLVAALFFVPVTCFKRKNALFDFYWTGFWGFLALITAVAGGSSTLMLLRVPTSEFSEACLAGILAAYVCFVCFAWFRLVGFAAIKWLMPALAQVKA